MNDLIPTEAALTEYEKERWCLEQAAAVGVIGPDVFELGRSGEHAYMIQSYMPGENAEDSPENLVAVWRELGRYAQLIHSIRLPGEGNIGTDLPPCPFSPLSVVTSEQWLEEIQEGIDALSESDVLVEGNVYLRMERGTIQEGFEQLKSLPFRSGLNHGDFSLKNAVVCPDGTVGLLDWGTALLHVVPYYELSQIVKKQVESDSPNKEQMLAFLDGYGVSSEDASGILSNATTLLLLRAFSKARWAVGCNHPDAGKFVSLAGEIVRHRLSPA
jgi:aminoglycoside phosphotransferase